MLYGRSVHNQRIERLWRDVFDGCISFFYHLFYTMEDSNVLCILDPVHLFCLQFVFKPRIQHALDDWRESWINHRLRTTGRSPIQMWTIGRQEELNMVITIFPVQAIGL